MTARARGKMRRPISLALVSVAAILAAGAVACGPSYFEIPIETPIQPKMDVSPFQRVLVAGFVLFAPKTSNAMVQRDQEVFDSFGRRSTVPTRTFMERKGFLLQPKFVFIDGRTGTTMYSERYREEILYNAQQNTPALSSYFELMDRLVPNFLSALSAQKIRGTRVLLN
jgi:hypothetical protein